ncbi:hypothetical protein TrispH2_006132 [Trichoplax sp. H2]|nr:hypothetical protein TrispH2_006132 [Trichoplax sp. H2]|eukprot:RDD41725.1 hypothetical protein TrispH2_006132 [Trichoplax sp. H2]
MQNQKFKARPVLQMPSLIKLPYELLQLILSHLTLRNLAALSRTCKELHNLIMSDYTWQNLVHQDLTCSPNLLLGENYYFFYKRMHIGHVEMVKTYLGDDNQYCKSIRSLCTKCNPDEFSGWKLISYSYKMYLRMPTLSEGLLFAARNGLEQFGRRILHQFRRTWHNYTSACSNYDNPIKIAALIAIIHDHIHFVWMLEAHASPRLWCPTTLISTSEQKLFYKALLSPYRTCRCMLNLIKPERIPPLNAAYNNDMTKLQQLISLRGIKSVNKKDRHDCNLLQYCVIFQFNDSIKILIDHGASINDEFSNPAISLLEMIIIKQNIKCFQWFIHDGNVQLCIKLSIQHTFIDGIHYLYRLYNQEEMKIMIREEVYLQLEAILKDTKSEYYCQFLLAHLDLCDFLDLMTIIKLVPYLKIDQSTITEFYNNNASLSLICMLSRSDLTPIQIAKSLPYFDLLQIILLLADKSLDDDMIMLQRIFINIIDTRCRIILTDNRMQTRYDRVINYYLQYLSDHNVGINPAQIVGKYKLV